MSKNGFKWIAESEILIINFILINMCKKYIYMYGLNIVFSVFKGTCKRAILRIWSRTAAVSICRLALRCAAKAATYECHMDGNISRRVFPPIVGEA